MTTQGEFAIAESWLYSTLHGDSTISSYVTGGIHTDAAPQGTLAPYIIFINKGAPDLMVMNQERVWTKMTYTVQLVVPGSDIITGDTAYVRIGQLLHKGSGTTSGGKILSSTRIRSDKGHSLAGGVEYRHLEQTFEILVQQS